MYSYILESVILITLYLLTISSRSPTAIFKNLSNKFKSFLKVSKLLLLLFLYSNNFNKGIRGVGNVFAEVSFLESFLFKSSFGVDAGYFKSENFSPAYTVYYPDGTTPSQQSFPQNFLTKSTGDNLTWLWENTLNFHKDIKKHSIEAVAGFTMQNTSAENNLRAKSGTMGDIKSYAGYVNNKKGEKIAFAVIANNYNCSNGEIRKKIEKILVLLADAE